MSHASLIVALTPKELEKFGGVDEAVANQMAPFDENGGWFKDGSRWDWYEIGGRYTGKFAAGHDPADDPENYEPCWVCSATGTRDDELGREMRRKDPSFKCNGCFGKGKMLKPASDWKPVGNVCRRADLSEEKLAAENVAKARKLWAKFQKRLAERSEDEKMVRQFHFGFGPDDTEETLVAEASQNYLVAYAFLKDRRWCENERMGWFGMPAATECVRKAAAEGIDYEGRCIHEHIKPRAKIVTWGDGEKDWCRLYWPRFVRNLPPETTLVCVDYHV